jgi:glycosyltransferase involved in cell wall biosynthesis
MAMGKPTIASPLQSNIKINRENGNLFATTADQWYDSLTKMINQYDDYKNIGKSNAEIVRRYYSSEENSKVYIKLFKSII